MTSQNTSTIEFLNNPFKQEFIFVIKSFFREIKVVKREIKIVKAYDLFNYLDISLEKIDWRKVESFNIETQKKLEEISRDPNEDSKPLRELVKNLQYKWWPELFRKKLQKWFVSSDLKRELMEKMHHPRNISKFAGWGFEGFEDCV
jgi:hypothetical protein